MWLIMFIREWMPSVFFSRILIKRKWLPIWACDIFINVLLTWEQTTSYHESVFSFAWAISSPTITSKIFVVVISPSKVHVVCNIIRAINWLVEVLIHKISQWERNPFLSMVVIHTKQWDLYTLLWCYLSNQLHCSILYLDHTSIRRYEVELVLM